MHEAPRIRKGATRKKIAELYGKALKHPGLAAHCVVWCFRGGGDDFEDDSDDRNTKAETGALLLVMGLGISKPDYDEDEDDDGEQSREPG